MDDSGGSISVDGTMRDYEDESDAEGIDEFDDILRYTDDRTPTNKTSTEEARLSFTEKC